MHTRPNLIAMVPEEMQNDVLAAVSADSENLNCFGTCTAASMIGRWGALGFNPIAWFIALVVAPLYEQWMFKNIDDFMRAHAGAQGDLALLRQEAETWFASSFGRSVYEHARYNLSVIRGSAPQGSPIGIARHTPVDKEGILLYTAQDGREVITYEYFLQALYLDVMDNNIRMGREKTQRRLSYLLSANVEFFGLSREDAARLRIGMQALLDAVVTVGMAELTQLLRGLVGLFADGISSLMRVDDEARGSALARRLEFNIGAETSLHPKSPDDKDTMSSLRSISLPPATQYVSAVLCFS